MPRALSTTQHPSNTTAAPPVRPQAMAGLPVFPVKFIPGPGGLGGWTEEGTQGAIVPQHSLGGSSPSCSHSPLGTTGGQQWAILKVSGGISLIIDSHPHGLLRVLDSKRYCKGIYCQQTGRSGELGRGYHILSVPTKFTGEKWTLETWDLGALLTSQTRSPQHNIPYVCPC